MMVFLPFQNWKQKGGMLVSVLFCLTALCTPLHSQQAAPEAKEDTVPLRTQLRFLTSNDFPPFNYYDEEGNLSGFHIDLAKAICR